MNVTLPPDQLEWLKAQVAAGQFASINEALVVAVADLMAIQNDDLTWAKPHVEQARASVARGDVSPGDEFFKRLDARLATLRGQ